MTKFNLIDKPIKHLELAEKYAAEHSLYEFFKQAWIYIEGDIPFIDSWHIRAICEHLEACYRREIKNLIISVPPRTGKTSLISIAFPAWVWIHKQQEKFLCASATIGLSLEIAGKARRLIQSDWYLKNWGNKVKLIKDQNTKSYYQNNRGGFRISTSVNSSGMGKGGSIFITDDLNDPKNNTEIDRNNVINWWRQVWTSRKGNIANDVRIIVQQRTHENDITGYIKTNDIKKKWTFLNLPNEFEYNYRSITVINGVEFWRDPRTTENELLIPKRINFEETADLKIDMGSYDYASQYQQRPSPLEGGIIKKNWFKKWIRPVLPKIEYVLQSWDTAISDSATANYSACTTWGVFVDENDLYNVLMLSMWRGRVIFPDLRDRAIRLFNNYLDIGTNKLTTYPKYKVDRVLIEGKATGDPLVYDLRRAGINATAYTPIGDKTSRVQRITHFIECGLIWLPIELKNDNKNNDKLLNWADEFVESVGSFPSSDSRDLVDSMTQSFSYLRDSNMLSHSKNPKFEQKHQQYRSLY